MERFEEYGVPVKRVVNCGGVAARSPLAMQIYADVMNRPVVFLEARRLARRDRPSPPSVVAANRSRRARGFRLGDETMSGVPNVGVRPQAGDVSRL